MTSFKNISLVWIFFPALALIAGCSGAERSPEEASGSAGEVLSDATSASSADGGAMSFFITSAGLGDGANLGGLAGADAHCTSLAEAAGSHGKIWRAYLSTSEVNARDRIGAGPWYNANGQQVAASIADLLSDNNKLAKDTSLSERGAVIMGRGDTPNRHDILTGTRPDGTASDEGGDTSCENWTSNSDSGSAIVGHHDRTGGGPNPTSWGSSHGSRGCSQANLQATGGDGLFYCFATN